MFIINIITNTIVTHTQYTLKLTIQHVTNKITLVTNINKFITVVYIHK